MSNAVLESIHQVLGNLVRTFNISNQTYVDKDDPWTGILSATVFAISSRTNRKKGYSPGQLIFGRDTILPIKCRVDCELICHRKQAQMKKDNTRENKHRFDYDSKVVDNVMITNHTAYKYETPFKGPFVRTHLFTNGMVNLHYGATEIRYNIRRIKPYKLVTKDEDFNSINISDGANI